MSDGRMIVTLPNVNGIPADGVQNSWSFHGDNIGPPTVAEFDDFAEGLEDFYNAGVPGHSAPVAEWISTQISRDALACTIHGYDLNDPTPRPLLYSVNFTLGAEVGGAQDLPEQVALVLSMHADLTGSTTASAKARRRGRIFIGPLHDNAVPAQPAAPAPKPDLIDSIRYSAAALIDHGAVAGITAWSVWSQADGIGRDIVGGWVDNRFDTQRRRLPRATSRSFYDASLVP